ncbi:MAG: GNAT family N-acetyltransferase [Methanomicrobiales archaeon]|nr:GNAT family N-acetyltransferase [Methanomicrobiales archaeon]
MFVKTLLPTDFSPDATSAIACIGQVPGIVEAVLLHVLVLPREEGTPGWEPVVEEGKISQARRSLAEQEQDLVSAGIRARSRLEVIRKGEPAAAILKVAEEEKVSAIAMGARGLSPLRRFLLGSVSRAVLQDARCHILLYHQVPETDDGQDPRFCRLVLSRILCPVDFSKPSFELMEVVKEQPGSGQVVLVHVVPRGVSLPAGQAESSLRDLAARLDGSRRRVEILVRKGDPVREILAAAEDADVSLIMIPRYGRKDYMKSIAIGSTAAAVAAGASRPVLVRFPQVHLEITAREMTLAEFPEADGIWEYYHGQKGDPATDRIFGVWVEGSLAAVARCRLHTEGGEVDAVFTPEEFRNRGYARKAMRVLVDACGDRILYMHSVTGLEPFYRTFGFEVIPEQELPKVIRDRYAFAEGHLEEAHVTPMKRIPVGQGKA